MLIQFVLNPSHPSAHYIIRPPLSNLKGIYYLITWLNHKTKLVKFTPHSMNLENCWNCHPIYKALWTYYKIPVQVLTQYYIQLQFLQVDVLVSHAIFLYLQLYLVLIWHFISFISLLKYYVKHLSLFMSCYLFIRKK